MKGLMVRPDALSRWAATLSEIRPLVDGGIIVGVHVGDELVWNKLHGAI